MDPQPKKRSLFGITNLFRSATPEMNVDSHRKNGATGQLSLPRAEPSNASHESPVKRASDAQLASRKIIGRPQGPSTKLSHTVATTDFSQSSAAPRSTNFSGLATNTPRRMPGDNPNRVSSMFSASTTTPFKTSTNFSGASTAPRNAFRSSAFQRPEMPAFTARVPPPTVKQSLPPNTPARARRASTADINGHSLSFNTSGELFKMRIPSPPRHLTGEVLAKEVPSDPSRPGSIYADEFLAHYCPPDLDEHQRNQFFCILDLRRLKYAANEVFAKKDWKINILNFAKEYEKSRSLIMVRYGLYDFKTVKASKGVVKDWKQKNGIPDSDDDDVSMSSPKPNGAPKRKAEDELMADNDTALTTSSSVGNKRARAPQAAAPAPVKNKRKADAVGEPDENHPSKLLKPGMTPQKTPSATKSVFEGIVNKNLASTAASATPAKQAAKTALFGAQPSSALFGASQGQSVFSKDSKIPASTNNIFGHLSDASKGSGNDDADAESGAETSSDAEEEESEAQETGQSAEPSVAASGGVSTPQFGDITKGLSASSASSDAGDGSQGRSIFERLTKGTDGQPVRMFASQEEKPQLFGASSDKDRQASPVKEQAAAPVNNTWNTSTPIKFGPASTSVFGSTTAQPAPSATIDFGAPASKKTDEPAKEPAPQLAFGAASQKSEQAAAPTKSTFGFSSTAPGPSANTASVFGGFGASTNSGPQLFGSNTSAFGQPKEKEYVKASSASATPAPSTLFGTNTTRVPSEPSKTPVFQSSTLFGNNAQPESQKTAQPQTGLFGSAQPAADLSKPFSTLFGASSAPSDNTTKDEPAAKKPAFGSNDNKPSSNLFPFPSSNPAPEAQKAASSSSANSIFGAGGAVSSAPETKSIFSSFGTSTTAPQTTSLFGSSSTPAVPETKNMFGSSSTPAATETKNMFGSFGAQPQESKPLFGNTSVQAQPKPGGLFGNAVSEAAPAAGTPTFSFGSAHVPSTSQPATSQPTGSIFGATTSFTFSAGGSDAGTIKNPFAENGNGTVSTSSSFNFGNDTQPPSFAFGNTTTPNISFGAGSDTTTQQGNSFSQPANASSGMFSFGGPSQPSGPSMFNQQPLAAPMFGNGLAPGGGTSTGTNSPFTFGGASSLATTPATGTPEPSAEPKEVQGTQADGDEAPQEQISLTEGGPGEEDESVVHEVRAKAVKLVMGGDSDDDDDSNSNKGKAKSPWKVQGVGPLRIMKHKTTGAVRMLLRAEPRGHVALNKMVLPMIAYKVEPAGSKYVRLQTVTDNGMGVETWMLQVKTAAAAQELADCLEANKSANARS